MTDENWVSPYSGNPLSLDSTFRTLFCDDEEFPVTNGIPRFVDNAGITKNWSRQWSIWDKLHFSVDGQKQSYQSFLDKFGFDPKNPKLPPMRILDSGCGSGQYANLFKNTQHRVWCLDSSQAIDYAKKNCDASNLMFCQADANRLPFEDEFFDFIFDTGTLAHQEDLSFTINHLAAKLRPGGVIGIAVAKAIADEFVDQRRVEKVINIYRLITPRLPGFALLPLVSFISSLYNLRHLGRVGRWLRYLVPEWHDDPEWRKCYIHDYLSSQIRNRQEERDVLGILRDCNFENILVREGFEIRVIATKRPLKSKGE
ncbi:MAG: class I SAM-dependent methyltransferase [Rhodospirillales bacterium]|nr:class I SAM-dependent methyltransferase [Rhodospirillales bacterium]